MAIPTVPNITSLPQMHEETKDRMDEILRVLSSIQVTLALLLVLGRGRDDLEQDIRRREDVARQLPQPSQQGG